MRPRDSSEVTAALLRAVLPNGGWLVTLCNAYFDESESQGVAIPVMTVGGYLFEADAAVRFDKRAKHDLEDLGIPYFHQTDCANAGGHYRGLGKEKCIESQNRLIRNIKKRSIFGFATSININQYRRIVGEGVGVPEPYTYALIGGMNAVKNWIERTGYQGDVAYFFEDGCRHKADAASFMENIMLSSDKSREFYRCIHWGFSDKRKVRPLQAADMIAWFTNQEFTRFQKGMTNRRRDFEALLRPQDRRIDHNEKSLRDLRDLLDKHVEIIPGMPGGWTRKS